MNRDERDAKGYAVPGDGNGGCFPLVCIVGAVFVLAVALVVVIRVAFESRW